MQAVHSKGVAHRVCEGGGEAMAEPERKCSTCKFYEPAPIWRKGWCRNPLLYAPQQSHLVAEDDLDCSRGLSDYWEAADGTGPNAGVNLMANGRDPFSRPPERGPTEPSADVWGGGAAPYGGGASGRATPPPDDDGYAPQETDPRPAGGSRYVGAAGDEGEIRNPWDPAQPGYGTPPAAETDPRYGGGYGYGYDANGQDAHAAENRSGYGDEHAGQNPWQPTGAAGYDEHAPGQPPGQGDYPPQNAYDQSGYSGDYGQQQSGYGQGEYDQRGYAPQGQGGGYDEQGGYGAAPPQYPPPRTGAAPPPTNGGRRVVVPQPAAAGKERSLSYYTEERYWTDYAKLAIPVVLVLALAAAAWFIGTGKLKGGGGATATPGGTAIAGANSTVLASGTPGTGANASRPAASLGPAGAGIGSAPAATKAGGSVTAGNTGPSTGVLPLTPSPSGGTTIIGPAQTSPVAGGASGQPPLNVNGVSGNKRYKVANSDGANMRDKPSTAGAVIQVVADGTEVQQDGDPQTTDGAIWYKVRVGDKSGYIRSDLLTAVG